MFFDGDFGGCARVPRCCAGWASVQFSEWSTCLLLGSAVAVGSHLVFVLLLYVEVACSQAHSLCSASVLFLFVIRRSRLRASVRGACPAGFGVVNLNKAHQQLGVILSVVSRKPGPERAS